MTTLNDSLKIGALELPNRIIMAPLTRMRSSEGRVPNELMATYYSQRAGAGLILTEATSVSAMGVGYPDTPGIWSPEQVKGWRLTRSDDRNKSNSDQPSNLRSSERTLVSKIKNSPRKLPSFP